MIRVVLADDHPFVRTGIRDILLKSPDIAVIGEAEDGFHALQLAEELKPDVLVVDIEMPGLKGFEVAEKLSEQKANLPVLALSAHEDKQYIIETLSHGAYGYLTKDEVPEAIVKAVHGVAHGQRGWVSRRVAARVAMWLLGEMPDGLDLSRREIEMLRMLIKGKSNEQIGEALKMLPQEVEQVLHNAVNAVRYQLQKIG